MANNYDDIILSKGALTITLFTNEVTEGGDNKLTVLPIPTTKSSQPTGQKDTKVVDLLRITNTFHIIAYITSTVTKTGLEIKQDLISMFKGAGIEGGSITMSYDGKTDYSVFAQKWVINKLHAEKTISTGKDVNDVALYMVTIDVVEGVAQ